MKTCTKCNKTFPLTERFFALRADSPDGFRNDCKVCVKKRRAAWHQKNRQNQLCKMKEYWDENREAMLCYKTRYNQSNREIMNKKSHDYYEENRVKVLSQMKEHRTINKEHLSNKRKKRYRDNYETFMEKRKEYVSKNREMINNTAAIYCANRRKTDVGYRILHNLRTRISHAVKHSHKSKSTTKLIGCTIPELRIHLAKLFTGGMMWNNYGQWHLDHIIPCASFDMDNPEEQRICFHFSNLQPLWAKDNLRKGARIQTKDEILKSMAF